MWEDDDEPTAQNTPALCVDLRFHFECACLPLDHAYLLATALQRFLPWFAGEAMAGLHLVHPPAQGNGWLRADEQDSLIYLSRRSKLSLRLPRHRLADAQELTGKTLQLGDYSMLLGQCSEKPLSRSDVLFSRYVLADSAQSEADFIQQMAHELKSQKRLFRKLLPGKTHVFHHPQGQWFTRSLMVADLDDASAIALQQHGLGQGRATGFGLFVPHKGIKQVQE
jgi:CRISPR-associated protein Cas6